MSMYDNYDPAFEDIDDDLDIDSIPDLDDMDPDFDDDYDDSVFESVEGFDDDDLTPAAEASIFMDTILESCENMDEFIQVVSENAVEWELYGLIPNAQRALEATRTIKVMDWKAKNRKRLEHRECIRLAKKKNDPNYKKYKKFRDLMRKFREPIFQKYESKAKSNVLKAQHNSRAKASSIHTNGGTATTARLNRSMKTSIGGKNPTHAPKTSLAA